MNRVWRWVVFAGWWYLIVSSAVYAVAASLWGYSPPAHRVAGSAFVACFAVGLGVVTGGESWSWLSDRGGRKGQR